MAKRAEMVAKAAKRREENKLKADKLREEHKAWLKMSPEERLEKRKEQVRGKINTF